MERKETPKRLNYLGGKDKYRLFKWIEENKDSLDGYTREQIAVKASKALEVSLTRHNIDGALEAMGLEIKSTRTKGFLTASNIGKNVLIAKALMHLYSEFGIEAPSYLPDLASNKSMKEIFESYNSTKGEQE